MAEAAIQFGPNTYRDGALERIHEARLLHQAGRYALCVYVAGLAVEGMLRGLCALRDAYFDEKHDLRRFGVRVAHLGLLRSGGRDHDFVARIQGIAQRWRNTLRFADRRQLERLLVRLGFLRWKHVDRGLKPLCNEYVEDCFAVVQRCELLLGKATFNRAQLEKCLTTRLDLTSPTFNLEKLPDGKLSGSVVSDTFQGLSNVERQQRIWDALDAQFGSQSVTLVGTLLAYTVAEWNVDLETPSKHN